MEDDFVGMSRRQFLTMAASMAMYVPLSLNEVVAQTSLRRTPDDILGPFYPAGKSPITGIDLTAGTSGRAEGQVVHIMGRVLNRKGEPVARANLEIWQANTHGRYTHTGDTNPAPLDPNFLGFAAQTTDEEGRFISRRSSLERIQPTAAPTASASTLLRDVNIAACIACCKAKPPIRL